jgi:UDP-N-acetylmuramoylalanine--D-glutamate ligase
MNIAILGYGLEGRAAYHYWHDGNDITVCDQNPELQVPEGVNTQLGPNYLNNLEQFDLVVRSPQIHPRDLSAVPHDKITSNVNEFLRVCPTSTIIGVTGTKGKGTTSTLLTKLLEAAGKRTHLGGNIGIPALELLKCNIQPDDFVVLELSNFQLIDLKYSPPLAICLMVVPEHLDWHEDIEEYIAAKQQLFIHQSESDVAIYYPANENSVSIADASIGRQIPYSEQPGALVENGSIVISNQLISRTDELKLLGEHNWQNVCAAVTAAWQITQDIPALHSVLTSFSGLPHRIEYIREYDGVRYYNDSFASGLGATEAAIQTISGKKVMILGGYERMIPIDNFGPFIVEHAAEFRKLLLIGESADRLAAMLLANGFENFVVDHESKAMSDVVEVARRLAEPSDAVVLSPGFASFDMFKNFEDRGNQFRDSVNSL